MNYGLLKYDEWDDLLWLYNSIDSSIRTSLTGSLIAINREDESIKYTHYISEDRNPYHIANAYNPYCGCFYNSINALEVYQEYLLVGKGNDLYVVSKNGERVLNVLTSSAKYDLTAGGTRHICCTVFPCTQNNSRIALSTNSVDLFFVDGFTGQIDSSIQAVINSTEFDYTHDKITTIADFMSNQSNSSCPQTYEFNYPNYQADYYGQFYDGNNYIYNSEFTEVTSANDPSHSNQEENQGSLGHEHVDKNYGEVPQTTVQPEPAYSLTKEAKNVSSLIQSGNVEAYGKGNKENLRGFGHRSGKNRNEQTKHTDRTIGSMSLEFILKELGSSRILQNDFIETTCVGMASGFMHLVDNRSNKVVSSINCNNNPLYSISASGYTVATTTCSLYQYLNPYQYRNPYQYVNNYTLMRLFEPVVYLHDIRMMKTTPVFLEKPVSKLFIVPKSDRLFTLSPEGDIFDITISTGECKKQEGKGVGGSYYYDLEVKGEASGDNLEVFTSDSTYSLYKSKFKNKLRKDLNFRTSKLPKNLQEIPNSESRLYNTTPFPSLVGTFDGDVAHIFVQMFFFLPKLPSIQNHVCEITHCITCQIGFGLHNLLVYYENNSGTRNQEVRTKEGKEKYVKKYSNNLMYVTRLQELMIVDNEHSLRTPLNLLLWLIDKINTEMYNYNNKNNFKVTTSLMKDLFSYSKKTVTTCKKEGHVNTVVTHDNYYLNYESILSSTNNKDNSEKLEEDNFEDKQNRIVWEYCKDCGTTVECESSVEYMNCPHVLIVDFTNCEVDEVKTQMKFNGSKYDLSSFYFTLPSHKLNHRSLAYIKLPKNYQTDDHEWILTNGGIVMYSNHKEDDIFNFTKHWKILIFAIYLKEQDPLTTSKTNNTDPSALMRNRKGGKYKKNRDTESKIDVIKNIDEIEEIEPSINQEKNILSVKGRLVPLPYPTKKVPIPSYILLSEHNIAHNPLAHNKIKTFKPLTLDELNQIQQSNFLFSLDIEYVKSELKTSYPIQNTPPSTFANLTSKGSFILSDEHDKYLYTLARVTAIRANEHMYGVPFLDHYILNSKPPKDYMTRFSGIRSGDLELKSSLHWLTTEKMVYLKLRYLVDNGCKIIGHGLEQDLRILNLCVPRENVIDTVELFWIPGKRYLSLQFLAHNLLDQRIQQNEHDSIEDAKAALQLYKMYINYKLNNTLDDLIEKLYEVGYKTNFTVN